MLVKPILSAVGAVSAGRFSALDTLTLRVFNDALVDAALDLSDKHLPGVATVLINTLPEVGVDTLTAGGLVRLGRRLAANTPPADRLHHIGHLLSAYGHSVTEDYPELIKNLLTLSRSPLAAVGTAWLSNLLREAWHLVEIGGDAGRVHQTARTLIVHADPADVTASEGHLLMAALHERKGERNEYEFHLSRVTHPAVRQTQVYRLMRQQGDPRDFGSARAYEDDAVRVAPMILAALERPSSPEIG